MKKSEKILLVILAISVVIFVLDRFVLSKKDSKPAVAARKPKPAVQAKVPARRPLPVQTGNNLNKGMGVRRAAVQVLPVSEHIPLSVLNKWRRDPFLGAFTKEVLDSLRGKKEEPFILKAISWRDSLVYVIINDDVFQKGETRNGLTVLDVIGERVVCSYNGKKFILSMGE